MFVEEDVIVRSGYDDGKKYFNIISHHAIVSKVKDVSDHKAIKVDDFIKMWELDPKTVDITVHAKGENSFYVIFKFNDYEAVKSFYDYLDEDDIIHQNNGEYFTKFNVEWASEGESK